MRRARRQTWALCSRADVADSGATRFGMLPRLDRDSPAGLAALDQAEFLEALRAHKGGPLSAAFCTFSLNPRAVMSSIMRWRRGLTGLQSICADFVVELRGFKPMVIAGAVILAGSPLGEFERSDKAASEAVNVMLTRVQNTFNVQRHLVSRNTLRALRGGPLCGRPIRLPPPRGLGFKSFVLPMGFTR
jgi:hypothetical protein